MSEEAFLSRDLNEFIDRRCLKNRETIFLSTLVDDETRFILSTKRFCHFDIEISPKELSWIEDD